MLPANCSEDEVVTRFIFSKSHFRTNIPGVKSRAFEPSRKDNSTSVFRVLNLSEIEIWSIREEVELQLDRTLYARADVIVRNITKFGLGVNPDEPPPRHANIQGWPDVKSERMSLAQQIAAEATLYMNTG